MAEKGRLVDLCLFAGELMVTYGAETYRAEDIMNRMAVAGGLKNVHSFVTTTGIFLSGVQEDGDNLMQMIRIVDRFQDLNKVAEVNQLSLDFVIGRIDEQEANQQLLKISAARMNYPLWLIYIASGVAGGAFSYLVGNTKFDMIPAAMGGLMSTLFLVLFQHYLHAKFFSEYLASFFGSITALTLVHSGYGTSVDQVIIGTIIPLVPGIPLTNSVRDLMNGDLISGLARGAEAALTALSIAAGVATAVSLFLP
ncbi:threonine/serine exporter family protein [Salicibibacter cibi]|uniref:Threonine/serine exporter family protein n=1 Tax=Salicibibacter cibi TaxID=2743001 RepID=A0A7T6Z8W5_9BACI|nr:threonine/serine exporter family protein [Salicibibacter cibi]QQK78551.1 threonine/serine exporter family protein [Salicibibacter cibi]